MIKPIPLKKGDKVAFIGTSSPADEEKIKSSVEVFEDLGLEVILGDSCKRKYGYLSGTDEIRANDLNCMFKDNDIRGIFAIRGGYGAARILHALDYDAIRNNPKIFVGYSDITILHIVLNQKCDLMTFHGPMPTTEFYKDVDQFTKNSLINSIFSYRYLGKLNNPDNSKVQVLHNGSAKGEIIGGNLSVICSSLGTDYEINTKDKILFLEEVGEEPYRVDRMLMQLKQAGKLNDASGIIFGAFTNCDAKNPNNSLTISEILQELILPLKKPSLCNIVCGHCLPTMTIPMGAVVELNTHEGAVRVIG